MKIKIEDEQRSIDEVIKTLLKQREKKENEEK